MCAARRSVSPPRSPRCPPGAAARKSPDGAGPRLRCVRAGEGWQIPEPARSRPYGRLSTAPKRRKTAAPPRSRRGVSVTRPQRASCGEPAAPKQARHSRDSRKDRTRTTGRCVVHRPTKPWRVVGVWVVRRWRVRYAGAKGRCDRGPLPRRGTSEADGIRSRYRRNHEGYVTLEPGGWTGAVAPASLPGRNQPSDDGATRSNTGREGCGVGRETVRKREELEDMKPSQLERSGATVITFVCANPPARSKASPIPRSKLGRFSASGARRLSPT